MKHVLYVEDSAMSQNLMRKYLDGVCDLTVTATLKKASAMLADRVFDLLIADYLFPEGDASELIRQTRSSPRHSAMPIIVVSSSMDGVLLSRVLHCGANDALAKPLKAQVIRYMVKTMLHAPYVCRQEHAALGVCCLQWWSDDRFYQYCPELNLRVEGATRAEAADRMRTALAAAVRRGVALGNTTQEALITHVVKT
ncbi:MAG: response regulator [Opitutae bacterium]|nr:response regulator [Opitutae bacterium]